MDVAKLYTPGIADKRLYHLDLAWAGAPPPWAND
jgi:hypothetical protein